MRRALKAKNQKADTHLIACYGIWVFCFPKIRQSKNSRLCRAKLSPSKTELQALAPDPRIFKRFPKRRESKINIFVYYQKLSHFSNFPQKMA
jgi:hypothetical protein